MARPWRRRAAARWRHLCAGTLGLGLRRREPLRSAKRHGAAGQRLSHRGRSLGSSGGWQPPPPSSRSGSAQPFFADGLPCRRLVRFACMHPSWAGNLRHLSPAWRASPSRSRVRRQQRLACRGAPWRLGLPCNSGGPRPAVGMPQTPTSRCVARPPRLVLPAANVAPLCCPATVFCAKALAAPLEAGCFA